MNVRTNKRQKEQARLQKRQEKEAKMEERKKTKEAVKEGVLPAGNPYGLSEEDLADHPNAAEILRALAAEKNENS